MYQRVRNVCFSENLACFVSFKHPFCDSSFYLITDKITNAKVHLEAELKSKNFTLKNHELHSFVFNIHLVSEKTADFQSFYLILTPESIKFFFLLISHHKVFITMDRWKFKNLVVQESIFIIISSVENVKE